MLPATTATERLPPQQPTIRFATSPLIAWSFRCGYGRTCWAFRWAAVTEIQMINLTLHRTTRHSQGFGLLALALALSCAACGQSREVLMAFRTEQQVH